MAITKLLSSAKIYDRRDLLSLIICLKFLLCHVGLALKVCCAVPFVVSVVFQRVFCFGHDAGKAGD